MSAATSSLRYVLARAAIRSDALMHVVSQRDTGLLNPICAAHPIRSAKIDTWTAAPADLSALCADCAALATSIPGIASIEIGLAVFLGGNADGAPVALLTEVPLTSIDLSPAHARRSPGDVDDLIASVAERGVITPVVLRRLGARLEVIDGGRRIYAAHKVGRTTVPAIVREATDTDALLDALVANLHRQDLNPIELAHAYQRAIETLGLASKSDLGKLLGVSRAQISNTIRLLGLPVEEQARIASGELTADAGRKLLAVPKPPAAKLADLSALLEQALAARVLVTARGGRTRIVIDVDDADSDRILRHLGATAAAA